MKNRLFILTTAMVCGSTVMAQPGTLDLSFGSAGTQVTSFNPSTSEKALAMVVQPDGKIILAGYTTNGALLEDFAVVRFNANGALDNTFGTAGKVTTDFDSTADRARAIALQQDGRIVVAGYSDISTLQKFALVRYNSNGTIDNTFGTNGKVTTTNIGPGWGGATGVAVQPDGKIVAIGQSGTSTNSYFAVARYNSDGSLDNTFSGDGKLNTSLADKFNIASSVAIQPDGRILVAGKSYTIDWDFSMARYLSDGTLDVTFSQDGKVIISAGTDDDAAHAIALQSDGKIILVGEAVDATLPDFAVVRLNADGTLDNSFGSGGKVITPMGADYDYAYAVVIQSDGRIVVGGTANSPADFALARYLTNGTLDPEFGNGGKVITSIGLSHEGILGLGLQASGKIIAAGYSTNGTVEDFAVARYNHTWGVGIVDLSAPNSILILPNPLKEYANLKYTLQTDDIMSIEMVDVHGKTVRSFVDQVYRHAGPHEDVLRFPVELPAGTYLIVISSPNGRQSLQVMKW